MPEIIVEYDNIKVVQSELLNRYSIGHLFTTRHGGVSTKPYDSLNMGLNVPDNKELITMNRNVLFKHLPVTSNDIVAGEQIHKDHCERVFDYDKGKGAFDYTSAIKGTDSLVTDCEGLPLLAIFADCVPIFIGDMKKRCVGIVHAGWRGIVAKNVLVTIKKMCDEFMVSKEDLLFYIGPSIGRDNFMVQDDVEVAFKEAGFKEQIIKDEKGCHIDLKEAAKKTLVDYGIRNENVDVSTRCTYDDDLFYSYRREQGATGRMAGIIWL